MMEILETVGLDAICDLAFIHLISDISIGLVKKLAVLLERLYPYFPSDEDALKDSPFEKDESKFNYGAVDDTLRELTIAFMVAARIGNVFITLG